ncbi:MAG: type II toxin-antitoxin system HicB family antitoxin [Microcystis aeruginosa LG13-11]|jgi:predicted RNase H-like HicB family nuclease|nr:type II toxin-antitoxin system HicB family antitoxin [Microcystis aeruginosa LG13-11]
MKIKVIVHKEETGYWAEVPALPGCATQGNTFEELLQNLYEAVEGCLLVDTEQLQLDESSQILEIAV